MAHLVRNNTWLPVPLRLWVFDHAYQVLTLIILWVDHDSLKHWQVYHEPAQQPVVTQIELHADPLLSIGYDRDTIHQYLGHRYSYMKSQRSLKSSHLGQYISLNLSPEHRMLHQL